MVYLKIKFSCHAATPETIRGSRTIAWLVTLRWNYNTIVGIGKIMLELVPEVSTMDATIATLAENELLTGEAYYELTDVGPSELIDGVIVPMSRTGAEHGYIEGELAGLLRDFIRARQLGWIVVGETGLYTKRDPDRVRAVDIAFISRQRSENRPRGGFLEVAPDLIVEIVSPHDLWRDLQDKVREYFSIGVGQVWIVDPELETVWRYRSPGDVELIEQPGSLRGEGVLEGFVVNLAELFNEA
jgi:Uma2 family endonuclease